MTPPAEDARVERPDAARGDEREQALENLRWIADSPGVEHGGFHQNAVSAAKWALAEMAAREAECAELREAAKGAAEFIRAAVTADALAEWFTDTERDGLDPEPVMVKVYAALALPTSDAALRAFGERERADMRDLCAKLCDERCDFFDNAAQEARRAHDQGTADFYDAKGTVAHRLAAAIRALPDKGEGRNE